MKALRRLLVGAAAFASVVTLAACSAPAPSVPQETATAAVVTPLATLPQPTPGEIRIDGVTGTLTPAEKADYANTGAANAVDESFNGQSRAFAELCSGQIDMVDSTGPINSKQLSACASNGLQTVQFEVAADGVVVGIENETDVGGDCLTTSQLTDIFRAGSPISRWSQLGAGYVNQPLSAAGPDQSTADFALFGQKVLGVTSPSIVNFRGDLAAFPSDSGARTWLVGTTDTPTTTYTPKNRYRVAFFHFSYYTLYEEQIRPFEVSLPTGAQNCVFPSIDTIASGAYPLSEQFMITTTTRSLKRPEVQSFLTNYLHNATALAQQKQLIAIPATTIQQETSWANGSVEPPTTAVTAPSSPTPVPVATNQPPQ